VLLLLGVGLGGHGVAFRAAPAPAGAAGQFGEFEEGLLRRVGCG
jgi:hypothetical protein